MKTPAQIGIAIKGLLDDRGLTQLDLAASTGLDKGTVNRIVGGKSEMSIGTLWKISRFLSVSLYDILGEAPDPTLHDIAVFLRAFEKASIEGRKDAMSLLEKSAQPQNRRR